MLSYLFGKIIYIYINTIVTIVLMGVPFETVDWSVHPIPHLDVAALRAR